MSRMRSSRVDCAACANGLGHTNLRASLHRERTQPPFHPLKKMLVKMANSRPNPHVYAAAFATISPQSRTSLYASELART
eukprot:13994956-Alexandrium_andersonii.AAC.1